MNLPVQESLDWDSIDWVAVPQAESYVSQYLLSAMFPMGLGRQAGGYAQASFQSQGERGFGHGIFIVLCPDQFAVQQHMSVLSGYTNTIDEHATEIQVYHLDGSQPPHKDRALLQKLQDAASRLSGFGGRVLLFTTFQKFKSIQFVDFFAHMVARGAVTKLVIEDAHLLLPQAPLTVYDLAVFGSRNNLQKGIMDILRSLKTRPPTLLLTPPLPAEVAETLRETFRLPVLKRAQLLLSAWDSPQILGFATEEAKKAELLGLLSQENPSDFVLLTSSRKRASILAAWLEEQEEIRGIQQKRRVFCQNDAEDEGAEQLELSQLEAFTSQDNPCVLVSGPQLFRFKPNLASSTGSGERDRTERARTLIFWDLPQSLWQLGIWTYHPDNSPWDNVYIFHSREDFRRIQNMWLFRLSHHKDLLPEVQSRLQAVRHWILDSQCHTKSLALYFSGRFESESETLEDAVAFCSACTGCFRRDRLHKNNTVNAGQRQNTRQNMRHNTRWMEGWRYVLRHFIY